MSFSALPPVSRRGLYCATPGSPPEIIVSHSTSAEPPSTNAVGNRSVFVCDKIYLPSWPRLQATVGRRATLRLLQYIHLPGSIGPLSAQEAERELDLRHGVRDCRETNH